MVANHARCASDFDGCIVGVSCGCANSKKLEPMTTSLQ